MAVSLALVHQAADARATPVIQNHREKMMKTLKLNNGVETPILGFGVFQIRDLAEC